MAHHPSPSPSGSSSRRRRLSEVLGEQQEPFSLDVYLLERGCSPAFLDATACGGGACSTCWPIKNRATGRRTPLRRRPATARNKKGSRRSGVLTMLLSKILSGTTAAAPPAPAATKQNRRQQSAAAIGWRRVVAAEKQSTAAADRFMLAVPSASPGAAGGADEDGEQEGDDGDGDEEEESKKQLSPVSVLEQSLFEHSPPPPPHSPKALAIFSELLEAAYTPNTLLEDFLAIARDQSRSIQSKDGRRSISTDSSTPPPPPPPRARRMRRRRRKKQVAVGKDDIGTLTSLVVASEDLLRPSVEDVAVLVAAAVLEALTEETAAELMMGMEMDRG